MLNASKVMILTSVANRASAQELSERDPRSRNYDHC